MHGRIGIVANSGNKYRLENQHTHSMKHIYVLMVIVIALTASTAAHADGMDAARRRTDRILVRIREGYNRTSPNDRVWKAGLAACGILAVWTAAERSLLLRKNRVLPGGFETKFIARLREDRIDAGKATDFCELSPSPAGRMALAVVQRWGRPAADLERAATIAARIEADQLKRNVATLRRVSWLAPLIGLLGTLTSAASYFQNLTPEASARWSQGIAASLMPLISGAAVGAIAFVLYDGIMGKVEKLSNSLDRLGAETADAVAMLAQKPYPTAATSSPVRGRGEADRPAEPQRSPYQPHVYPGADSPRPKGYRQLDDDY